ncbi:unnamed protein product [Pelagomonas calceolata]|uniref:Bifunctional lysine-specific demethylase and histidyl-hydroxylase n=2 Tax=Pelagomonas calceolata TaxID=35677 RepID=A0A8J2S6N3_9STRA|nr:unnamed protein product [Pelagomonas calceolata]
MRASLFVLLTAGTTATTNPAVPRAVHRGGETAQKKTLDDFLRHLGDGELATVWEQTPKLWRRVDGCGPELFSFEDAIKGAEAGLLDNAAVADGAQAEAGRWVAEKAGAASADDLKRALAKGTVFFNGAGLAFPALAALGAACHRFLGLPANINVYVTDPRREVSVSPHSDAQNVLVFQCSGMKRWRVWPPPPRERGKDPFGRGKGGDRVEGLGEPVLDVTLQPGDVLYVPLGWVHATSTADSAERSCHATLGVDTYFYGLCWSNARSIALARNRVGDDVDPGALDEGTFSRLYGAVPVGFLRPQALDNEAWLEHFVTELRALQEAVGGASPLGDDASLRDLARFYLTYARDLIDERKYQCINQIVRGAVSATAES